VKFLGLDEKDINIIFKGDQNVCWDALITDLSLINALENEKSYALFIPFIHNEKLGVPDQNLIYCQDLEDERYLITEDYSDSAGDACYINIDTSYGLFYLPAIELERLKKYKINVKSLSKKYSGYINRLDKDFLKRIGECGFLLDFNIDYEDKSFGSIPNKKDLSCLFDIHPEQKLFYLFSKSWGRFGIVPVYDHNFLFSSIKLSQANISDVLKSLFYDYLLKGLLEQAYYQNDKDKIIERSKNLVKFIKENINSNSTIADLEFLIFVYIAKNLGFQDNIKLLKSSFIFASPQDFGLNHFFLNLSINSTESFINAYNNALNETQIKIQRIKLNDNFYNIPFYANVSQYGNIERNQLFLNKTTKALLYRDTLNRDYKRLEEAKGSFITGKAIPFLSELCISPNAIALPEQGSKYSPAVNYFIKNLRNAGLNVPDCLIIRIGLNFLDNLNLAGDFTLNLPKMLHPFFGSTINCVNFSLNWRKVVEEIYSILGDLNNFDEGQFVKEAEFIVQKNKYLDPKFLELIINLISYLNEGLENLRNRKSDATEEEHLKVQIIKLEIELAVNFYKQRLLSIADGLSYLNDRPYSIAVYLMFGANFVNSLIRNVTFRTETM